MILEMYFYPPCFIFYPIVAAEMRYTRGTTMQTLQPKLCKYGEMSAVKTELNASPTLPLANILIFFHQY